MNSYRLVYIARLVFALVSFSVPSLADAQDPEEVNHFSGLSGNDWVAANAKEAEQHFAVWKVPHGAERRREAEIVRFYAWRAERLELIDQVIADGHLKETEVLAGGDPKQVVVTVKREFPNDNLAHFSQSPIWRRITAGAFEIWTPRKGWLFNSKGELLNSAAPPRNKSGGRQWFGAFIPDGRWITTELLADDGRIYVFDRKGRCTREIKAGALLENDPGAIRDAKPEIVPWARSTGDGKGWVVRVGSEEGRGESLLNPDGTWSKLSDSSSPWRHCMARQLGVRLSGGICNYRVESEDGAWWLESEQPGHGTDVGNPLYQVSRKGDIDDQRFITVGKVPGSGNGFGFWPHSRNIYILGEDRTWFFDASGNYQGWIAGVRVGDSRDGDGMIFRLNDNQCVSVSPELKVTSTLRFDMADGRKILPLELYPEIGLGVFALCKKGSSEKAQFGDTQSLVDASSGLVLATWALKAVGH